jgi:predicted ATPase
MRLLRLDLPDLPGFTPHKNLGNFRIRFSGHQPITVLLGRNGSGKSNLLEALVILFSHFDRGQRPDFSFRLAYRCRDRVVRVSSPAGDRLAIGVTVDGRPLPFSRFASDEGRDLRPAHVFGYYSGPSNRLERHFDAHQERFYRDLIEDVANPLRPLFYARPVHAQFVLLAFFSYPASRRREFLNRLLGIESLESILFVLRRPPWAQARPSAQVRELGDPRFWYARGRVQWLLDRLYALALAPLRLTSRIPIDFRRKITTEHLYLYLPNNATLLDLADGFSGPVDFFKALESLYISKLLAEVRIRVRVRNIDGALTFRELSEGEQQLVTVLGLLEFTKENESLFLLDEPDTHLNPAWSMNYVQMLQEVVQEQHHSHLLMATHDPLVIYDLLKSQVKILKREDSGQIVALPPTLAPEASAWRGC